MNIIVIKRQSGIWVKQFGIKYLVQNLMGSQVDAFCP